MNKQTLFLACVLALPGTSLNGWAQAPMTPDAQLAADSKAALARYEADKNLCNDEASSNSRVQCRRDAKASYDQAVSAAKDRQAAATKTSSAPANPGCTDCGTVTAVSVSEKAGQSSALGMIAGGVGGAVLGHQVGGGTGKDLATIAGAVGGAYAGKKIEEKVKSHKVWTVSVDYGGTTKRQFEFNQDPGFKVGDAVKNEGKSIKRQ